jgi:membrane protein
MTSTTDRTAAEDGAPAPVLTPIPGTPIDAPPRPVPKAVHRLERTSPWATVAWKAYGRFRASRSPLIAGGTAYYAFLAMFSLLALVYGVAALVSADRIAEWLTDALEEALPGLIGDEGIDPDTLARVGRTSSVVGLVLLVWSGSAVMVAASDGLHQIYGAPPDGRNVAQRRLHLLGWLAVIGPLVVLSYTLSTAVGGFGQALLEEWGVDSAVTRALVLVVATLLTFGLDVGIMVLLLGRLGGIRPARRPLLVGAVVGAVVIGLFKALMAVIVSWSVDKPQYGSFTIPIAVLVVLWLQALGLYASACLTAGAADTAVTADTAATGGAPGEGRPGAGEQEPS